MHAYFVIVDNVGSNHSGDYFAAFSIRINNTYYELGGLMATPQLIGTDCVGGYKN